MKAFTFLLCLVHFVVAGPLGYEQVPINGQTTRSGFSIDLNDRRLVEFEGQEPKWLTELEKVRIIIQSLAISSTML